MKKIINLSTVKKDSDKIFKKIFYVSVGIFSLTIILSFALVLGKLNLTRIYNQLQETEDGVNTQLLLLQEKKFKYEEVKARLSSIKKILSQRSPILIRVKSISDILPTDSNVNSTSGNDKKVQISLNSSSLKSLNDLIEKRLVEFAKDNKKGISRVEMTALSLSPQTKLYSTTLLINFQ